MMMSRRGVAIMYRAFGGDSFKLPGGSSKKRESLAQYLAGSPISLKKVRFFYEAKRCGYSVFIR
jgi:hypothetical protein